MVYFSHSGQDTQAQKEQGLNGLTVEKPHIMNSFHWRWRWRWFVQNFLGFLKPFSHCCFTSFFQSKGKKLFSSPTHTPSASFVRCQSQSSRRDTPQILWSGLCTCTTPAGGKKQNKCDDSRADVVTASVSRQTPLFLPVEWLSPSPSALVVSFVRLCWWWLQSWGIAGCVGTLSGWHSGTWREKTKKENHIVIQSESGQNPFDPSV